MTPKRIYVFSPSSAVRNKPAVRRGIARLKALGHEVELDPAVFATHMRFAGDDETRLAAIGRAAASGADIAIITRGGYGLTRLLPRLPYKAIAKAMGRKFVRLSLGGKTLSVSAVVPSAGTSPLDFVTADGATLRAVRFDHLPYVLYRLRRALARVYAVVSAA